MQCLVCSEQGAKGFTGVISSFLEPFSSQTDLPFRYWGEVDFGRSFSTNLTARYVDKGFAAYLTLSDFQNCVRNLAKSLKKP